MPVNKMLVTSKLSNANVHATVMEEFFNIGSMNVQRQRYKKGCKMENSDNEERILKEDRTTDKQMPRLTYKKEVCGDLCAGRIDVRT